MLIGSPRVTGADDATVEKPRLTRAAFLKGGVALAGALAIDNVWNAQSAAAHGASDPRPIPGGFDANFNFVTHDPLAHAFFPVVGLDMSTITDFRGTVAGTEVQGTAHGSDGSRWWFDADMRFMQGHYVAIDGRLRERSFAFI
jgi:hypothetical protein